MERNRYRVYNQHRYWNRPAEYSENFLSNRRFGRLEADPLSRSAAHGRFPALGPRRVDESRSTDPWARGHPDHDEYLRAPIRGRAEGRGTQNGRCAEPRGSQIGSRSRITKGPINGKPLK